MSDFTRGKLSRRSFLKGSVASAAGVMGMLTFGNIQTDAKAEESPKTSQIDKTFRVYETDVVVVGGGLSGTMAAYNALMKNVNVIIVDKGPYAHSGTSGINWGTWFGIGATKGGSGTVSSSDGLADQVLESVLANEAEKFDPIALGIKAGSVYGRDLEGNVTQPTAIAQVFMPRLFAHYVKRLGAKVLDRVMITDILTAQDGTACGVVGFDIVGGEAVVIRAKSVVMATGSSCWLYGWGTASAKTNAGLECTGDGVGILLNHGLKLRNFESVFFYGYNCFPEGIAYSQNIGAQATDHPYNISNAKGEYFMKKYAEQYPELAAGMSSLNYFKVIMSEIMAGNMLENDGYYLDIPDLESTDWQTFNRGRDIDIEKAFGIEMPDKVEMRLTPYSTPIKPEINQETCETKISGLYYANESEDGVWPAGWCAMTGRLCGVNAAETAKATKIKAPAEEDVIDAIQAIYAHLDRTANTGKRPIEIQHAIQNLVHEKAFYLCTEEGLNEAIVELQRIKAEDIPNMKLVDDSRNFNNEWKQALEVPFMWQNAMAIALTRLNRRETRASHFRADYPEIDNENLLKNIYISQTGDEFKAELTDIVTNGMTVEDVKAALIDISHITRAIQNK